MPKQNRIRKAKFKAQKQGEAPVLILSQQEQLQALIDLVMRTLFNNSDKHGLSLQEDIFDPYQIVIQPKEMDKVWDVLTNSGLVSPLVGFGNAGKVELTSEGIKMMAEYGGYKDFLEVRNAKQQAALASKNQNNNNEQKPNTPKL